MTRAQHRSTAPDGTSLAWTQGGSGRSVVLVHGITEQGVFWDPIVDRLEDRFHVIVMDLRGHGSSGSSSDYGLASMAGDVAVVMAEAADRPAHLVGHSLGGAVVSVVGAAVAVASVTNVDQSLRMGAFKEQLTAAQPMLIDSATFPLVMEALFDQVTGQMLSEGERERISKLRRGEQEVVLGIWELILGSSLDEIEAAVDEALAGYSSSSVPYLSLFGSDPGEGYEDWLRARVPGAIVEQWPDHGHYPHLVDPDRFVDRLVAFWDSTTD